MLLTLFLFFARHFKCYMYLSDHILCLLSTEEGGLAAAIDHEYTNQLFMVSGLPTVGGH